MLRRHALTRDTFTECGQLLSSVPVPAFLCMISSMLCLWTFRCHSTYTPPHRDTEVRQARQPDETLKPGLKRVLITKHSNLTEREAIGKKSL